MNITNNTCSNGRICQNKGTLQCSICLKAYYCSKQCQTKDWIIHKHICGKKKQKSKPKPTTTTTTKNDDKESKYKVEYDPINKTIKMIVTGLPDKDVTDPMVFVNIGSSIAEIDNIKTHCSVMFKDIDNKGIGEMIDHENISLKTIKHLLRNSSYNETFKHWEKHIDLHYNKGDLITILIYDWLSDDIEKKHFVKTICFIRVESDNTLIVL